MEELLKTYEWPIISGVMFNHESEFRSSNFLIMNLIEKAIEINNGAKHKVTVPSLKFQEIGLTQEILQKQYLN